MKIFTSLLIVHVSVKFAKQSSYVFHLHTKHSETKQNDHHTLHAPFAKTIRSFNGLSKANVGMLFPQVYMSECLGYVYEVLAPFQRTC